MMTSPIRLTAYRNLLDRMTYILRGQKEMQSMRKTTSVAYSEKVAKERGWKIAPKDHPIYSEGSSIMFLRHTPKRSQERDTASHQSASKKHSD